MKRYTRRSKKVNLLFLLSSIVICVFLGISLDWVDKWRDVDLGCYRVVFKGSEIGYASSEEEARTALLMARLRINEEEGRAVYSDSELTITKEKNLVAQTLTSDEMQTCFYDSLRQDDSDTLVCAYTVNVDGFSVTVESKQAVVELLNGAKEKFDIASEFSVELVQGGDEYYQSLTYEVSHADTGVNACSQKQFASVFNVKNSGEKPAKEKGYKDGLVGLEFAESVDIVEAYVNPQDIIPVDEAILMVTKEKEKNETYTVEAGDTLWYIASKFFDYDIEALLNVNPGYTENSVLSIGDKVVVMVPKPELSVVVKESRTYVEKYRADVEYVKDDSMYTTESYVIDEGTPGKRRVVAEISYTNGVESGRKIIHETVLKESSPKVVKIGTMTPPTYVKPISGGVFTSGFGWRWGALHAGIDWGVPIGTTVFASCGGSVIQSGWYYGYGYCVTIAHPDGMVTRYGHMSSCAVSAGEYVSQGQVIGYSGNTGDSTGPHLHFETRIGDTPVDPFSVLQ